MEITVIRPDWMRQRLWLTTVPLLAVLFSAQLSAQSEPPEQASEQSEAASDKQSQAELYPTHPETEADRIWVDGFRDGVQNVLDSTASWVDGFFGEPLDSEKYEGSTGRLIVAPQWDEHDGFTIDSSFRAKLKIPHAKEQFSAVIGRGDFDDFVAGDAQRRPSVMRRTQGDDEWLVGLGFDPYLDNQHDLSFGAGIRGGLKLDTYVRARYRFETMVADNAEIAVQSVGFWRDSDGFGVAQDIHHEVALHQRWVAKTYARATFAERTDGIRWNANSRIYYLYDTNRALASEVWIYGETHHEAPIQDYGIRGIHRQRFLREWLFMETWVGTHWPKETELQQRTTRWMVGIEFEMILGNTG